MCRNLHLCFWCTVQICDFCIWKNICAADLRILCTTHFCTFAHLHIYTFAHLQKLANMREMFLDLCAFVKTFCKSVRICEIVFWAFFTDFHFLSVFCKFVEKVEISENVRKCPEKSSRVPEWYTSGSWANAFDNTGWQKSPEYALIRIAAGAPDLAKSGQIRPRTAPDGKSSRIWRRFRFCSTGWNPVRSCFFLTRAQISDPSTCSRGASSSATESDTFCKCAHTSQNTRWKPPSGPTTFCTPCTPCTTETDTRAQPVHTETQTCTLVHTSPQPSTHWQRTHRPCVALVGGGGERTHPFVKNSFIMNITDKFSGTVILFLVFATRVTLNAKSNISGGDRMRRSHKDPDEELCGTRRNASDFARTFFHKTEKGRKKEPKRPPLFYIYIACKGPFLDGFRDGRGTEKVDSPKRRGRARGKTMDVNI